MLPHDKELFLPLSEYKVVHTIRLPTKKALWKKVLKIKGLWKKSWHF